MENVWEKMNRAIADIHTHIIPDADDGSIDMDMSISLIKQAFDQGVTTLFATSHSIAYIEDSDAMETYHNYELLQKELVSRGIPVSIFLGSEIFCLYSWMDRILDALEKKQYPSMNDTRYVLIEFSSMHSDLEEVMYCSNRLMDSGWIPVYAHIERYRDTFASIDFIKAQKQKGCLFQMNYESLYDEEDFGIKDFAWQLIEEELIDFMGSDTHNPHHRPPLITNGLTYLRFHCRKEYLDMLLYGNVEKYFFPS